MVKHEIFTQHRLHIQQTGLHFNNFRMNGSLSFTDMKRNRNETT